MTHTTVDPATTKRSMWPDDKDVPSGILDVGQLAGMACEPWSDARTYIGVEPDVHGCDDHLERLHQLLVEKFGPLPDDIIRAIGCCSDRAGDDRTVRADHAFAVGLYAGAELQHHWDREHAAKTPRERWCRPGEVVEGMIVIGARLAVEAELEAKRFEQTY
jgi:hypothetical protein